MPYIDFPSRNKYISLFNLIQTFEIETKGDLEYLIFLLMKRYMQTRESRYATLHDCVYAAQHCADEFRRRYLDKREDQALQSNGDI
jgi:hypothetical protein